LIFTYEDLFVPPTRLATQTKLTLGNPTAQMHTKSRKVIPVASVEFRVKLVLAAVVLSFLLWVTNGRADEALELLRSKSVDFGSTAGAAALLGREWQPDQIDLSLR
jgi:hypothetical protein